MAEFFYNYGLFLAKTMTLVVAVGLITVLFVVAAQRKQHGRGGLEVKKLNQRYRDLALALQTNMLDKSAFKQLVKKEKDRQKAIHKQVVGGQPRQNLFVLNFHGDIRASAVASLREEISAILTVATENDEVFLQLESTGGMVHAYGLAASQLMRIRDKKIPLTVAVDKVAASGGYMMACVANRIIAAPFSIIGSIGVLAQIPNFHKVLKKYDIDYEQFTAGEFKRTVTMFAENSDEAKSKFQEEIEDIHALFKDFIAKHRPEVDIQRISTGESWPGARALEVNLVDELQTSDDYLLARSQDADLYEVHYTARKSLMEKIGSQFQRVFDDWWLR